MLARIQGHAHMLRVQVVGTADVYHVHEGIGHQLLVAAVAFGKTALGGQVCGALFVPGGNGVGLHHTGHGCHSPGHVVGDVARGQNGKTKHKNVLQGFFVSVYTRAGRGKSPFFLLIWFRTWYNGIRGV